MIASQLQSLHPHITTEIVAIHTTGDVDKTTPLHLFNAKALWTTALEDALRAGQVDLIVHCLKDMPTQLPTGMQIGAVTEREDGRDVVCMKPSLIAKGITTLAQLPEGSVVGAGLRRSAQAKRRYPGLKFADCRGNVDSRLKKLDDEEGQFSALILAAAGLQRLGLHDRITQSLTGKDGGVMYAVGQGALAIEVREGDERMLDLLKGVACQKTWTATLAERSLMRTLEGGCSVPIGVETDWIGEDELAFRAAVVSLDGQQAAEAEMSRVIKTNEDADQLGWDMARLLVERGADKILEEIKLNREIILKQGAA